MTPYAARATTLRNRAALLSHGWRLLLTPGQHEKPVDGFKYALDNGAWSAYQSGKPFDGVGFLHAMERVGAGADWIVIPDIVAGGMQSLEFSRHWIPKLRKVGTPLLLAVQDGMAVEDVIPVLDLGNIGIFVGGTTEWKLRTLHEWGELAAFCHCHLHVGRVNTKRRIKLCQEARADSFDGSSATRYSVTLPMLDGARRQLHLIAVAANEQAGKVVGMR